MPFQFGGQGPSPVDVAQRLAIAAVEDRDRAVDAPSKPKARPDSRYCRQTPRRPPRPCASITGEPELPPIMSLSLTKSNTVSGSTLP